MPQLFILYDLIAFTIGIFSIGCIFTLMKSNKNEIIKYYFIFNLLLTAFIGIFLLGAYLSIALHPNPILKLVINSIQFLCLFLSLYAFSYLINKAYQVNYIILKNRALFSFSLIWWILCSLKEFLSIKNNILAVVIEDEFFIAVMYLYILVTYLLYRKSNENKQWYKDIYKIFIIVILSTPGLVFDGLTAGHGELLYFTPIFVIITSMLSLHFLYKYNLVVQDAQYEIQIDFTTKYAITERENEVIILLLKGYAYNKIAETLCISLSTVRTHVMNIYKKVGINSRFELYNKVY